MAILEMIPPEYWRRLKKELARLNLDEVSETALPWKHPDSRRTAIQFDEVIDAIVEERCKGRLAHLKRRIYELEWVAEKRKEKIGELDLLLREEIKRRENVEHTFGNDLRDCCQHEQDLLRKIAELEDDSAPRRKRGRPKKKGRAKGNKNKKKE